MVVTVTLVHTPACHLCEDARAVLAEVGQEGDLAVELVEADSDAGRELVARHRPAMFPLILVDGSYFSVGRLPRGKLRTLLANGVVAGARR
jgi:glutaredoxin-like protein DUF836